MLVRYVFCGIGYLSKYYTGFFWQQRDRLPFHQCWGVGGVHPLPQTRGGGGSSLRAIKGTPTPHGRGGYPPFAQETGGLDDEPSVVRWKMEWGGGYPSKVVGGG
jgi:hypothetical protein